MASSGVGNRQKSGRGPPHSKTLRALKCPSGAPASWSAPALWRFPAQNSLPRTAAEKALSSVAKTRKQRHELDYIRPFGPRLPRMLPSCRLVASSPRGRMRFLGHLDRGPPRGFTALFNGQDLTGWRGGDTFDHRKLLAMPAEERAAQIAKWTDSMQGPLARRERRAGQRRRGRLRHHREGLRRLRAARRIQDRAPGGLGHLPARLPAGPDLGLHREGQVPAGRRQRLGRALEQQPRRARQRPAGAGRQAVRRVEHRPGHHGRARG